MHLIGIGQISRRAIKDYVRIRRRRDFEIIQWWLVRPAQDLYFYVLEVGQLEQEGPSLLAPAAAGKPGHKGWIHIAIVRTLDGPAGEKGV